MLAQFTAVIIKRGHWYAAFAKEIPGANSQGRTRASARRNLADAVRIFLKARRQLSLN
jgi:predicted RNase H-like HicB family nuclease